MVIADGQKLTLGDTTLTFYLTPGHTPGTVSTLIPVKDGGRPHLVAEWGGTGFNFQRSPERFRTYIDSAERFRDLRDEGRSGCADLEPSEPRWIDHQDTGARHAQTG